MNMKKKRIGIYALMCIFMLGVSCVHDFTNSSVTDLGNNGTNGSNVFVETAVISPAAGDYIEGSQLITITASNPDAVIYYTTDGSIPNNMSSRYTTSFNIIGSKTVRAIVYVGQNTSAVVTAVYNLNAGKTESQMGVVTGKTALASNLSNQIKTSLSSSTIYIYSDEMPGVVKQSQLGESFCFDGLDTSKSYSFYFSNKIPALMLGRSAEVETDSNGDPIVAVKVSDVTPVEGAGLDLATVELKPTGTIRGYAYRYDEEGEKETDHTGITVFIPGTSYSAYTDRTGVFAMSGVPQGLHTIRAMYAGYTYSEQENILLSSDTDAKPSAVIEEPFELVYARGIVKGSVILSDQSSYSGVNVILYDVLGKHSYTAVTTASGAWSVNEVVPGTYSIEFNKDGHETQTVNDIIVAGAKITNVASIILREYGGSVSGSVSISASTDAAGVTVLAERAVTDTAASKTYYALTNASGEFVFESVAPGTYTITATYAGYKSAVRNDVSVAIGDQINVGEMSIKDKATYSVTGSCVLEGMESGFEGTSVLLQSSTNATNVKSTTTNIDGTYTFSDVDTDNYVLTFSRNGFITNASVTVDVGMKAISVVETIALKTNAGMVSGNVTLESAETSEGIAILITNENDNTKVYNTITDIRGHYAVAGIAPGTYRVQATKSGYNTGISDPFTVSSGVTSTPSDMLLSISLRALYGTVKLEGKTDYTGVRITATKTTSTKEIYSALSNKDGFYALSGMTPGEYILSYSFEGYRSYTSASVSLSNDSSLNLDEVQLVKATGKISGIVNLEGCTDYSGIKVTVVGTDYTYTTEADGNYEFTVPSGNYPGGVRFEKEDYQLTAKAETIPVLTDSTYGVLTVEMKALANTLKGIVKLAGTENYAGIKVSVDGQDSSISCTTKADGVWQLNHVPLGYQTVRFSKTNVPDVTVEQEIIPCDYMDLGTLEMIPDSATLKGFVFLDGMSDHSGIAITVSTVNKDDIVVRTSSDGAFIANNILASGSHTITFSKEGWVSKSITIDNFQPLEERSIGSNREYVLKDTTAPTWGSNAVVINSGANFTNSTELKIDLNPVEKGSGITQLSVQLTRTTDGVTSALYPSTYKWQSYQIGFKYDLKDLPDQYVGNGTYTLYIALKDKSGNISEKATKSITITDLVTSLTGVLTGDKLHLTEENSPYIVEADCLVSEGDTLIIDPGVEVRFAGKQDEDGNLTLNGCSISVSGSIIARGTAEKKILFTSDCVDKEYTYTYTTYGEYYDDDGNYQWGEHEVTETDYQTVYWNGIAINGGSVITENTYNYVSGNIMEYCEFEYADTPLTINADAYINKCKFKDSNNNPVYGYGYSSSMIIINNIFESGYYGYGCFVNNKVYGNLYSESGCLLCNNTIENANIRFNYLYNGANNNTFINSTIEATNYSNGSVTNNNFIDCGSSIISTTDGYQSGQSFNYTHNYWGAAQTDELESKGRETNISFILDYYDNFNYARFDYSDWATEPFENCGYSETGFVAFDYTVNGYDFQSNYQSGYYYPESKDTGLRIELNPQYSDNPISYMRLAQSYAELKAAEWQTYSRNTTFTVDKNKLVNGAATLYVQVKDSAGNASAVILHSIPFDTPVVSFSIEDGASFGSSTKKQSLRYCAEDLGNITAYTLSMDGSRIRSDSSSWGTRFESSYTLPLGYMAAGTHTLTMTATDSAGNTGEKTISFTINRSFNESDVANISYDTTTGQFIKDADTIHLWHLDNDGKENLGSAEIDNYTHTNGGFEGAASSLSGSVALDISTNAFTVEFWTRGNGSLEISKGSVLRISNYYYDVTSYYNNMSHCYTTTDGVSSSGCGASSSARARSDDQWHYWVYVYDSIYTAIYCDGVCVGYADGFNHTLNTSNDNLSISSNGIIDELRISKSARSADEINAYYKTAKPILDANTGTLNAIVW